MTEAIDDDSDVGLAPIPLYAQEPVVSEYLKWLALELQRPFYFFSKSTIEATVSSRYQEQNLKVYVFGVMALGTAGMALSVLPAVLGAGLYWISDRLSSKSYTYIKGAGQEITPSESLKMMTLNACMLPGGLPFVLGGLPPASERMEKLASLIRKQNPDILLLQEMAHDPSIDLFHQIKDLYPHFFVRIGPNPPLMESGLFVASKYPIQDAGFIPYDDQVGILRGAFWIQTPKAVIFTTHMEHGEERNDMRVAQLSKIKEKMAQLEKPCFLLGDLNIDRYLKDHYEESGIAKDFHDPIPENTPTCSCKLEATMRGKSIPEQPNEQDDYALLRRGEEHPLELDVQIVDTYEDDRPYDAISDHKAIILTATKSY